MLIDKDGRIFGKINIIDLCILLAIVAGAAFFAFKMQKSGEIVPTAQQKKYEMKFYVEQVESFVVNGVKEGQGIYDDSKSQSLGKITNVTIGDSIEFNPDKNGILVSSAKEGYNKMEITSELTAVPFENGIMINGNKYGVGHSLTIRAGQSVCFMRISGIEEKGADN